MPQSKEEADQSADGEQPANPPPELNHSSIGPHPVSIWQHQQHQQQHHQPLRQFAQQPSFPPIHQYQITSPAAYPATNIQYVQNVQQYEYHVPSHYYQNASSAYPIQPITTQFHTQFNASHYSTPATNTTAHHNLEYLPREKSLLQKFDDEVLTNAAAARVLNTSHYNQPRQLQFIRDFVKLCASKGLNNFYVTYANAKEFIVNESAKGVKLNESLVREIMSSLTALQNMNKIVYGGVQTHEPLDEKLLCEALDIINKDKSGHDLTATSARQALPASNPKAEYPVTSGRLEKTFFKLSEVSKHRLSEGEVLLLKKFDNEVIESDKTTAILRNLTENTFKSYSTDIKRFIKFCARQGRDHFLLEQEILTKFIKLEFNQKKNKLTSTRLRNLRSSLLKLHQLNSLAYDIEYSEGQVVYLINKFLDNIERLPAFEESEQDKLLARLESMCEKTTLLSGLSEASRKLYFNEYSRYVMFCGRQGLDHFHLTGELIKTFFIKDIIARKPNFSAKKLQEILSRLNRLHSINAEEFPNYPSIIPDIHVVKEFLKEYKKSTAIELAANSSTSVSASAEVSSSTTTTSTSTPFSSLEGGEKKRRKSVNGDRPGSTIDSLPAIRGVEDENDVELQGRNESKKSKSTEEKVPPFVMNRNIETVTQLVEEWYLILQRNSKYGQGWIQTDIDFEYYHNRKVVMDLIEQLLQEAYEKGIKDEDCVYDIANVFDDYMERKHIGLDELTNKVKNYSIYTKREFLRILSNRKR